MMLLIILILLTVYELYRLSVPLSVYLTHRGEWLLFLALALIGEQINLRTEWMYALWTYGAMVLRYRTPAHQITESQGKK